MQSIYQQVVTLVCLISPTAWHPDSVVHLVYQYGIKQTADSKDSTLVPFRQLGAQNGINQHSRNTYIQGVAKN